MSKQVNTTLPDETYRRFKELSEKRGMSLSAFARHCIQVYLTAFVNKNNKKN